MCSYDGAVIMTLLLLGSCFALVSRHYSENNSLSSIVNFNRMGQDLSGMRESVSDLFYNINHMKDDYNKLESEVNRINDDKKVLEHCIMEGPIQPN